MTPKTKKKDRTDVRNFTKITLSSKFNFGVGLNQFLFEQDPYFVKGEISAKIQEQLDLYLPHVLLLDLQFQNQENFDAISGNLLSLRLIYKLQPFNQQDFLDITIE